MSLSPWPQHAPFALFLSHDVDQIHDRELFRLLADGNHIRRMLLNGERGSIGLALRRMGRALFRPKPAIRDFETLVAIESRYGFRSTWFLLHDKYWARQGARYAFTDPEIKAIVQLLLRTGNEIGLHGGYYRFNNAAAYRESRDAVAAVFGVQPVGIRNHLLRFSGAATWRAQWEAGLAYDATYGWADRLGCRHDVPFPFFVGVAGGRATGASGAGDLLELPLTVMDVTLFRYLGLSGERALAQAWEAVQAVVQQGGLVSLLWHNNYFNEPEYADWQWVYEELLKRLAARKPWCATGAEINAWWRTRFTVGCAELT
ncbi:MAG: hypothetical protein KA236_12015 [Verrucomicrobia bacterium]|nr:hypothetical protein [Verrucomicrobiota bacterium]